MSRTTFSLASLYSSRNRRILRHLSARLQRSIGLLHRRDLLRLGTHRIGCTSLREVGVFNLAWHAPERTVAEVPPLPPLLPHASGSRRIVFAVCRETDASEALSLLLHLPADFEPLILVSRRHPVMGTILRRYGIGFEHYGTTDEFYRRCTEHGAACVVWASFANIDRYEPGYQHVFIDHGMSSKGHFMRDLAMAGGPSDLNAFALVCAPNRFTFDRLQALGFRGQLTLTGYIKGDLYVTQRYDRCDIVRALCLDPERPTVLYLPTNVRGIGTGSFERYYRLVATVTRQLGYNLIVKPHEEDYVRRPQLLAAVDASLGERQVIVLDWESPAWISTADVVIGDASSANIEALMARKPVILLPANRAQSRGNTDADVANEQVGIQQNAASVAGDAHTLARLLRRHASLTADASVIPYFNAYFDGRVHTRVWAAINALRE